MNATDKRIDQLTALIYEKTVGQRPWSEIGDEIAEACGLAMPLMIHQPSLGAASRFLTNETAPTASAYDTHYRPLDFVMQHVVANEGAQSDFEATKIMAAADREKNEFWMDFIRPQNSANIYYTVLSPTDVDKFYLSFHLAAGERRSRQADALRRRLSGHLSSALGIALHTLGNTPSHGTLSCLFDDLDCPAAVLRVDGSVLEINDAMRDLLGNGLRIEDRRLWCDDPAEQRRLDDLLGPANRPSAANKQEHVTLARTQGPVLHLRTVRTPLRTIFEYDSAFPNGMTLLLVTTAQFPKLNSGSNLVTLGLTAREAVVANLVGGGMSPEEAAVSTCLKLSTTRQYLKQAYEKLGINRQSELSRLVLRLHTGAADTGV